MRKLSWQIKTMIGLAIIGVLFPFLYPAISIFIVALALHNLFFG